MSENEMVVVDQLKKVYPGGVRAVAGIDFAVTKGEFFGFLGPNGAGKTTTMKVLSTLLKKTSGRVVVAGHDVDREPDEVRRSIGFAMQEVGLDDLATGEDFLALQGVLYGLSRHQARRRALELLELVGLTSVRRRRVGTYSGGMRRRIDLVAALIHSPPLLFLDEPTTGLDPQSRLGIWEYLEELNGRGVTIFLTTQMMEEADRLCNRIAIIDQGSIVIEGAPEVLKSDVGGDVIHLNVDQADEGEAGGNVERAKELLLAHEDILDASARDGTIAVTAQNGNAAVPEVVRLLDENGVRVTELSVATPSLDDVFLKHTGRTIRDEGTSGDAGDQVMRAWLGVGRK